jgi:glucokinase
MKYTVGFDLGGTKMLCLVFNKQGDPVARLKKRTLGLGNGGEVFKEMAACLRESLETAQIAIQDVEGACFAIPGIVDFCRGLVLNAPNIGFVDYPLKKIAEKEFNFPILVENDVNAGTYGEVKQGAALGLRHVIGLFPGTGLGSGLVLDGRLYRGAFGGAGEFGHTIVQAGGGKLCGCGQSGCLEAHVSRLGLAKEAVALAASGKAPTILEKAGTDFSKIKSGLLAKSVEAGEKDIGKIVDESARYLGIGMANCVNIFNPEAIVLGGGLVEKLGERYLKLAEKTMRDHALASLAKSVRVFASKLGDDAVAVGASLLLRERLKEAR